MNICFLLGGFTNNGGIGRVTSILANELCNEGYNVHTLSYFNTYKENLYYLNSEVKQNFIFGNSINMTKGMIKGGPLKLRKYLIENNIDILIACGALYFPLAATGKIGTKTKCICWEHSNANNSKDHAFQKFSRWIGVKNSDLIITLTKHDKQDYIKKYKISKVRQIYNPIDEEVFKYVDSYNRNSKKILSVGRLSYQKNFELLIEVAKEVLEKNPEWEWHVYGNGNLKGTLESKIQELELEGQVILKGQVKNLYSMYSLYSMLVMTSRYEGFPMSLLEGTAHRLPLISFDILTGPNEIIENDKNGYLIEPYNKIEMINSINYLINSQSKRIQMSVQNEELSKNYKLNKILDEWKKIFNEVTI